MAAYIFIIKINKNYLSSSVFQHLWQLLTSMQSIIGVLFRHCFVINHPVCIKLYMLL